MRLRVKVQKVKTGENSVTLQRTMALLIVLQPAFLLLAIRENFRPFEMGNTFGTFFAGVLLGCLLLALYRKLNLQIVMNSYLGMSFLTSPCVFYILILVNEKFNFALFWLVFIFVYLIMGAAIYIRSYQEIQDKTDLYIPCLLVVFLLLALMVNFISRGAAYSPDSYSYYDMSKEMFRSFGSVNTIRQYIYYTELGISFPYLFPMLIAVVNTLTGFSIYSGNIINLVAALISVYLLVNISRRLTLSAYPGLIASALMLFNPDYLSELMSARAVPLSVLCVLLILNIVVHSEELAVVPKSIALPVLKLKLPSEKTKEHLSGQQKNMLARLGVRLKNLLKKRCIGCDLFLIGLFAGAGVVIRFDFLAIAGLVGVILVIVFVIKKDIFKTIPFYALGLLVFTLPWMVYSITNFQTLWISDNSGTLFMLHPAIPLRAFMPDEVIPSFFTDPGTWFASRQITIINRLSQLVHMITRPVEMVVLLGITAVGIVSINTRNSNGHETKGLTALVICIVVIYIAKSIAIYLVGYSDMRYHAETIVVVFFTILCKYCVKNAKPMIWSGFAVLVCFVSLTANVQPIINGLSPRLTVPFVDTERVLPLEATLELEELLMAHGQHENGRDVRLLAMSGINIFEFGAHSNILSFAPPEQLNDARLLYVVENFIRPNYIYTDDESSRWVVTLSMYYHLDRVGDSNAFTLTPLENP
jgi:hypothetical protein